MGKDVADLIEAILFSYSTKHLKKSDKVRFYYALKGRDGKSGVIKRYVKEHIAKTVLLVPKEHEHEIEEFLTIWRCNYQKRGVYLEKI